MDLLLALHRDGTVREVGLSRQASEALAFLIDGLARAFLNAATEQHPYEPGFRPEDDGVVVLDYGLPESLWRCRQILPNDVLRLNEATLTDDPPTALVAVDTGRAPRFCFQAMDRSDVLRQERSLFFNPGGFEFNAQVGLLVPERIDAIHKGGRLHFRSEFQVHKFLGLASFFEEATSEGMKTFFGAKTFVVDDWNSLKEAANSLIRRKLHRVLASGRTFQPKKLQAIAERLGLGTPEIRKGRVVVPSGRAELRDFVRILNDDFLESLHDQEHVYLTTSKRAVKGP
jgi:hypothetical protein